MAGGVEAFEGSLDFDLIALFTGFFPLPARSLRASCEACPRSSEDTFFSCVDMMSRRRMDVDDGILPKMTKKCSENG